MKSTPVIAYLIPEFPGQTHIWMWREISHLREWGVDVRLFSTRKPRESEKARHRFAESASTQTTYIMPIGVLMLVTTVVWLMLRPGRMLGAIKLAKSLPVDRKARDRPDTVKLIVPAAVLARQLLTAGATHLHIHSCASAAILGMLVKQLADIPYSMTLNADLAWWGGALKEKFEHADFTIAITQRLLDEVIAGYPTLSKEQRLLGRIGVDTREYVPAPDHTRDHAGRNVVTVARLHPSKGHDILIRAIAMLRARNVDVVLRIAGAGPAELELRELTHSLKIEEEVTFLGSIGDTEVIRELQRADVFVLASHAEPLGVAYMEAMSCGVATVGTAAGGVGEIITSGVDGVLVPPKDVGALADAIEKLLSDPDRRHEISVRGRETIIGKFDSRIGAATLFERLFQRGPPSR